MGIQSSWKASRALVVVAIGIYAFNVFAAATKSASHAPPASAASVAAPAATATGPAPPAAASTASLAYKTNVQQLTKATIPSSGDEIKREDGIKVLVDAPIFKTVEPPGSAESSNYDCAPSGSRFVVDRIESSQQLNVSGNVNVSTPDKGGAVTHTSAAGGEGSVSVHSPTTTLYVHFQSARSLSIFNPEKVLLWVSPDIANAQPYGPCDTKQTSSPHTVSYDRQYTVDVDQLQDYGTFRSGLTYGVVAIPFKYEFSDHSFVATPSALGYIGWQGWGAGSSFATIIGVGPGFATGSTQNTSGGSSSAQQSASGTKVTYTAAGGFIATLGDGFKAGVMSGYDWQGRNSGFKYEGKPWLAISFGYAWN